MKYLKKFNESISNKFLNDVTNLCDNYLAYLKDDGFEILIESNSRSIQIRLRKPSKITYHSPYLWEDVKDSFIPFIEIILQNYNIKNNSILVNVIDINKNILHEYYIDEFLPDKVTDELITNISFIINKK